MPVAPFRDLLGLAAEQDVDDLAGAEALVPLALTEASGEVLRGQRPVMLRRDLPQPAPKPAKSAKTTRKETDDPPAYDAAIFERLRAWRGKCAKEQGVPAYVVFHDATLRQIAAVAPATLAELSQISGVGEAKLGKYGEQILEVLGGTTAGTP